MAGRGSPWVRAFLTLAAAVSVTAAAVLAYFGWRWVRPTRGADAVLEGADPEEVRFDSLDGVPLRGVWLEGQEGYPSVVMCHGYFKSLAEPLEVGRRLNRRGYNVFLFDFRACGKSGGRFTTIGAKETLDVLAAVRLVKARWGRLPIGVVGISMGAASALMAAASALGGDIAAVVADSPYAELEGVMRNKLPEFARWRWLVPLGWVSVRIGELLAVTRIREVRPIDFVEKVSPRPILFIYGEKDSYIPWPQPQELFQRAGEPKEIWYAPGSDHAVAKDDYPEEYQQRVEEFFDRYLLSLSLPVEGSQGGGAPTGRGRPRRSKGGAPTGRGAG